MGLEMGNQISLRLTLAYCEYKQSVVAVKDWRVFPLVVMLLVGCRSASKAQGFVWTRQIGMSGSPIGEKVATDTSDNVYVTGGFVGTARFGSTNLTSVGTMDIFLAKYDKAGDLLWVKQAAGASGYQSAGRDICTDLSGNVYVTGQFQGMVNFGGKTLTATGSLPIGTVNNQFIAKYGPSGNLIWVVQSGGTGGGAGMGIAWDHITAGVYTTGYNVDSGGIQAITFDRWNSLGQSVWHQEYAEPPNLNWQLQGNSVKVDNRGNVYITGRFATSITLGTNTLSTLSGFGYNTFIVKLDARGNVLWAQQPTYFSPTIYDSGNSLSLDPAGNLYVAGNFAVTNLFGTNQVTTPNDQIADGFIVKCDPNGNYLWAAQAPANGSANLGVAADNAGNVYVTGLLSPSQVYLAKYDGNGNLLWTLTPAQSRYSDGYGIAVDLSNRVSLVTWATSSISFDNSSFTNIGGNDIFISQVSEQIPPVFLTQPRSSPVGFLSGDTYTFTSSTRSLYPVTYQWQFFGTNLDGATNTSLTITNAKLTDAGPYQVIASNVYGSSTGIVATLTVSPAGPLAQIFTANYGNGTVGQYTTTGTVVNPALVTNLDSPVGIALSGDRIFVSSLSSGTIGEYTTSGATINSNLITGLQSPQGLAVDSDGNLYVANYAAGTVGKYTSAGATVNASLISGLNGPLGIALDGSGNLFVVSGNGNSVGKYTTSGAAVNAALITGLAGPETVLADGNGHLFVSQRFPGTISEYTTTGATVNNSLITSVFGTVGMALDGSGHLFVAIHSNTLLNTPNGKIGEYLTSGVVANASLITGLYWPQFMVLQTPPSAPVFQSVTNEAGELTFSWSAVVSRTYQIQYNTDLNGTNWNNLGSPIQATNLTMNAVDPIGSNGQRFYRAVLLP
jgi:streptogramin lyase